MSKRKINYVISNCKEILKTFDVQGYESVMFTALFYRTGKKLNSIENASTHYFADLVRNYDKSESPDKVKIEFRNEQNNALLWSKEYSLADIQTESVLTHTPFQGFGEAEINDIVGRKIADYEKIKEAADLREQLEELTAENEELRGELEEAADQLNAKKQVEYYANLLGMAMPGLAKVLGKSQAGLALGFLSGIENEPTQIESPTENDGKINNKADDSQATIIQLIDEYMSSLDNATLSKLYLIMCEFSSNSEFINKTLELITKKE